MSKRMRQRGVAVLESLVGVLIVVGLVLGAWYILQSGDEPKAPQADKTHTATPKITEEDFIAIKEWGVEFAVPVALKDDVRQGLFTFHSGDQAVYFASQKLAVSAPDCDLKEISNSTGSGVSGGSIALGRTKERPEPPGEHSFEHAGYWYTMSFANGAACYEHDGGRTADTFNAQMETAIKQLQLAD